MPQPAIACKAYLRACPASAMCCQSSARSHLAHRPVNRLCPTMQHAPRRTSLKQTVIHPAPTSCPQVADDDVADIARQAWGTDVKVEVVTRVMGLSHAADTVVGDAMLRGISGGERRRLTTAEMLTGPMVSALLRAAG